MATNTSPKFTKTQARETYDNFHNVLRCWNGGTREENLRMAPTCLAELEKLLPVAAAIIANPAKPLAKDAWLMEALSGFPARVEKFRAQYPEPAASNVIVHNFAA